MSCAWGNEDCLNEDIKCYLCVTRNFHYNPKVKKQPKPLARRQAKASNRKGSEFELKNHQKNQIILSDASSRLTPNSGAGHIKGDEEIRGIIEIMEELKQQNKVTAKGKKTFSIQKEWLEKLHKEALQANKEFWYLKFSFGEDTQETYVIVEDEIIMSMVKTMVEDRKAAQQALLKQEIAEKERRLLEAENVKLLAEIDLLKTKLKQYES